MSAYSRTTWCLKGLLLLFHFSCLVRVLHSTEAPDVKFKAVNLGGWLVTEGWIKPSLFDGIPNLFDGIPNKDLLDGTQVQLRSTALGKYLCAENGGGWIIVANRPNPSGWETFKLWRVTENQFQFRVFNGQFIGLNYEGASSPLKAVAVQAKEWETFEIIRNPVDQLKVHIRSTSNGMFLQAKTEDKVTADLPGEPSWEDNDPAVFHMNVFGGLQGEFQVTNGYGPQKASQVMQDHWNSFIVEEDFMFIAKNGLNSVRIPVGWWTARDPTPPAPFVGGSLQVLDNAFSWAEKYGLKVILDLHAPRTSQNGQEHSATRDGTLDWGKTQESIDETVTVIDFFASRYANRPVLAAVELINEPHTSGASLQVLSTYYKAGYDTVRKYSQTAYVIMSSRLGSASPTELFSLASGLTRTVIDVHYYSLFIPLFNGMTAQQNIDYVYNNRVAELNSITTANGPLIFVGEWVAEWNVQQASKEDIQRFAQAQLQVFGRASFGWAYWTLKNVKQHWSLRWMIENGYITL